MMLKRNSRMSHLSLGCLYGVLSVIQIASGAPTKAQQETKAQQPHLVFVLIDDMGFNDFYTSSDLSAAWSNVGQLASSECLLLENFYTQPICTPSRGSFITGRMPLR